jgi:SAM-dependent methyltransferase
MSESLQHTISAGADPGTNSDAGPVFSEDWFSVHIPVWTDLLKELVGKPDLRFLEVGVLEGRSVHWLLTNILTHPTSKIVCVDNFQGGMEHQQGMSYSLPNLSELQSRFMSNIAPFAAQVEVRVGQSQELLRSEPMYSFDFVYIDGSHKAADVLEDAVLSMRLLKPGGIMIFDDYLWAVFEDPLDNPRPGIDAFLHVFAQQYDLLWFGNQVAVRKI